MSSDGDATRHGSFAGGRSRWLEGLDRVRNRVRQELIARQLDHHLGTGAACVLDVGAGQGTQSIRLARLGHEVLAVEPDPAMLTALRAAVDAEPADVRARLTVEQAALGELAPVVGERRFDAVLLYGVLMYLPDSVPALRELAPLVAPGGLLALAARNAISTVWRPAARQDWPAALAALAEYDAAAGQGRDVRYVNEIGTPARADTIEHLVTTAGADGLELERWYGVRIAVDLAGHNPAAPTDPDEWAALLAVEERLAASDPFRQLGQLAHVILRRPRD